MYMVKANSVSKANIVITIILAVVCVFICLLVQQQFNAVEDESDSYIECESALSEFEQVSEYLTEQARKAATTGKIEYVNAYCAELKSTKSREAALERFKAQTGEDASAYKSLLVAMSRSDELATTEIRAMRLAMEGYGVDESKWPEDVREVSLASSEDKLTAQEKQSKASKLIYSDAYESMCQEIRNNIERAQDALTQSTKNSQGHAVSVFNDAFLKLELLFAAFALLALAMCVLMRKSVVKPLVHYNKSIENGEIFPVEGVAELRKLANTYNRVYRENQETQKLIKHQAGHDPLTGLLNRGSYDKLVELYEQDGMQFARILVDVDTFKQVNDTYGHEAGDQILKRVAQLLTTTFRSIDYVCRIGGDEFAVIMVEMTSDLAYNVHEKVAHMNEVLATAKGELPGVSLSVGVAFADRDNPAGSLFTDADKALYHTKENGRCGCTIYGE